MHIPSRRWTNKIRWRRSGTGNIHLFILGPPNSRRRSKRFSRRIRRVYTFTTSRLISGCRWSTKWFLVRVRTLHLPPARWTQSQTSLAERRIIPYSTEINTFTSPDPQGISKTGGGGPARVPNLRVCKHLTMWGGTRREWRMNKHPAVVPSSWRGKNLQWDAKEEEPGCSQKR